MLTSLDLFCGAGGFSLGMEQSGVKVHKAFENNFHACETYKKNFPSTEVCCADIRTVDFNSFYGIDLIIASPPCQGLSKGGFSVVDDPRNKLIMEFVRAVKEASPQYYVMETVPGILRSQYSLLLNRVADSLSDYRLTPIEILDAAKYGVPQRRKRVFLLGAKIGLAPLRYPTPQQTKVNVRDAIFDLPTQGNELEYAKYLSIGSDYAQSLRSRNLEIIKNCSIANHSDEVLTRFKKVLPGKRDTVGHQFRLDWNGLSPTLRAGSEESRHTALLPIHPQENRMLTVREAARISSFPDWFEFTEGRFHGGRQVGNAVPPFLARAVGFAIQGL